MNELTMTISLAEFSFWFPFFCWKRRIILKQTDMIQLTSLKIEDSFLLYTKKSTDDMFIYDIDTLAEAWRKFWV